MRELLDPERLAAFKAWLEANGAEIRSPTSPYELLRFRTGRGIGVVYSNADKTKVSKSGYEVFAAWHSWITRTPWRAAPRVASIGRRRQGVVKALLKRDGENCFYCKEPLGEDISIEHFVARTHGGPNHMANMVLTHHKCNQEVGHLSVREKITLRETWGQK